MQERNQNRSQQSMVDSTGPVKVKHDESMTSVVARIIGPRPLSSSSNKLSSKKKESTRPPKAAMSNLNKTFDSR